MSEKYYCPEHKFNPPANSGLCFCPYCEFPEGVIVTAKVKWVAGAEPGLPADVQVLVRKVELGAAGRVVGKYGLSWTGEWLPVGEGMPYPDECLLPVKYYYCVEGEEEP